MSFPLNNPEINKLNLNSIDIFINNDNKIFKIGKDSKGREFLEVKNKNLLSWIAIRCFGLNSYKMENIKKIYYR